MSESTTAPPQRGRAATLVRGSSWQLVAQLAPLVVNLALTPYVITGLDRVAYGLFLVVNTLTQFLGQFDGGISRSAQRFFTLYAGQGDRRHATRLLLTLCLLIAGFTAVTMGAAFIYTPSIVEFFHAPPELFDDTVFLLRTLIVVIAVALMRNLFSSLLYSHHKFSVNAIAVLLGYVVYAIGMVWSVESGADLRGVAYTFVAQQIVATIVILPQAFRYLDRDGVGLVPAHEVAEFARFSWKVQISGLLSMAGLQGSTLIVGRLAPLQVPDFGPGATFAQQLRMLPMNALNPMQTMLGRAVGEKGPSDAIRDFLGVQRMWVRFVTGFVAAGAPAAFFGVNTWLPLEGRLAGSVAAILLVSHLFALWGQVLVIWCMMNERPELEMWSGALSLTLNLTLSVLFVGPIGVIGVAVAGALGQLAALALLIRTSGARLPVPVRSPLSDVPWLPMVLTAIVSFGCVSWVHWGVAHGWLPRGAIGLILCGLGALPALALYAVTTIGLQPITRFVSVRFARR